MLLHAAFPRPAAAVHPSFRRPHPRLPLPDRCWTLALGILVAVAYSLVGLRIHHRLGTGMDLAIFDQGVRTLAAGHLPTSSMKAVGMNLWGDHFHPVILLAAPAYWLRPKAGTLVVVQAIALGLTCATLARCALRMLPGRRFTAGVLGLSLAAAPGVQSAMTFDVHEVGLGMPLVALAAAALVERRWGSLAGWSVAVLLIKEDAGLVVLGLAAAAFVLGARWLALGLAAVALVWTALVVRVVIPALSPTGRWLYGGAVHGPTESLASVVASLDGRSGLWWAVALMLAAGGFLALRSPLVLAVLPALAVRATSGNPFYWGMSYHYNLLPSVLLAFAVLDGLRRSRARTWWTMVLLGVALHGLASGQARDEYTRPVDSARMDDASRALAAVPSGAPVAADVYLTAHLTASHPITQKLLPPRFTDDLGAPVAVDWVVLDTGSRSYGGAAGWTPAALDHFRASGFVVDRVVGEFVVLHRVGGGPPGSD